ncbi:MAG: hypothetical protein LBV54_08895, partial [Puniceicoccales bacterium]|nr:hypothetical protein [Puniceicoccales bacterium]
MKKLTHFAARLLLHLTLFFAFVGGADKLSAQTGTWYFTGLENSFAGSSSSPPRHIEDKLTISQSGDSYTIA